MNLPSRKSHKSKVSLPYGSFHGFFWYQVSWLSSILFLSGFSPTKWFFLFWRRWGYIRWGPAGSSAGRIPTGAYSKIRITTFSRNFNWSEYLGPSKSAPRQAERNQQLSVCSTKKPKDRSRSRDEGGKESLSSHLNKCMQCMIDVKGCTCYWWYDEPLRASSVEHRRPGVPLSRISRINRRQMFVHIVIMIFWIYYASMRPCCSWNVCKIHINTWNISICYAVICKKIMTKINKTLWRKKKKLGVDGHDIFPYCLTKKYN